MKSRLWDEKLRILNTSLVWRTQCSDYLQHLLLKMFVMGPVSLDTSNDVVHMEHPKCLHVRSVNYWELYKIPSNLAA